MNMKQVGADAIHPYLIQIQHFGLHRKRLVLLSEDIWALLQNKLMSLEIRQMKDWQRNYHDHIIRNKWAFKKISDHIIRNPITWERENRNTKHLHFER
jgi:hypothetical protein